MRRPGLFSSLLHRDYRLMMASFAGSVIGTWAYNVAFTVWLFERTQSPAWLGAATIGRFVPALLFSAYGGVLAERFERVGLMALLDALSAAVMAGLAVVVALDGPVLLAILITGVTSTMATVYEPAASALTPQLVSERDLSSANALRNTVDNLTVIAGPGLGVALLWLGPPAVAVAVNSASFLVSAIVVSRIRARSEPVDVTAGGEAGPLRQTVVGARAILASGTAAVLVGFSAVATLAFGADTVLFPLLSRDILGTGADGYGYLLAGLGTGGVIAAPFLTRAEGARRLSWVIAGGIAAYLLPTLLFLVISSPAGAFGIQVLRGAGTLFVDVLALTALQRTLPRELLARVFGAFGAILIGFLLLGAVVTPLVISAAGLTGAIWFAGAGLAVACLAGLPALRGMDRRAAARRAALAPRVALLASLDLFSDASLRQLEEVAGAAEQQDTATGDVVVREGDAADALYVVMRGVLAVTAIGEHGSPTTLRDMHPGDYFGEIGLLEHRPRTATVTASTPCHLLRIDGAVFLAALTESTPSTALMEGAAARLARTHPSLALTGVGLE